MQQIIYWRGFCTCCHQGAVYGWKTNDVFHCCACHDENDNHDNRIFINNVLEIECGLDYIIEDVTRPESPKCVIDF